MRPKEAVLASCSRSPREGDAQGEDTSYPGGHQPAEYTERRAGLREVGLDRTAHPPLPGQAPRSLQRASECPQDPRPLPVLGSPHQLHGVL